jgi:glucosyl-3-phosphoglycerate synthase
MSQPSVILVGLANPRTAEPLVRTGLELARARAAALAIVSVVTVPPGHSLSTAAREARAQRRLLLRAARIAAQDGIEAESIVRAGYSVDEALAEVVDEVGATLLVAGWAPPPRFGPYGESPLRRLSQDPPCDLLFVRREEGTVTPGRILVPVRGGSHAELAVELAVSLARPARAPVTILRIIPPFVPEPERLREEEAFQQVWQDRYADAVTTRTIVAESVRACLLQEAREHELVIMGAATGNRARVIPLGAIAEEIAEHAACPVYIARTVEVARAAETDDERAADEPDTARAMSLVVDKWFAENTFHSKEFSAIGELVRLKEAQGLRVSLVLPTLNEEETIGEIIRCMQENLQERQPLLDELIVIDSRSRDRTVAIARSLGVPVYVHQDLLPHLGAYHGKGEALWKSLSVAKGDIIAWIDTDIANIHPKFVYGLLGPLLREPRIGYVKGFYKRPLRVGGVLEESSGGRVTELMARPLLNLFYPLLSGLVQPLAGEYAGRRELLEQLPFSTGYGVEIGLLIDILERSGLNTIGQVDLAERVHRNQSLSALGRMSFAILQTVMRHLEQRENIEILAGLDRSMKAIVQERDRLHLDVRHVEEHERPPMASVRAAMVP